MINITDNDTLQPLTIGCTLQDKLVTICTYDVHNTVVSTRIVELKDFDPVIDVEYAQEYINK
jgi:hypothetical protein